MAKKLSYGVCHFELFSILETKWQKKANRQLNSRGELFFKELAMVILYFKNSYIKYRYSLELLISLIKLFYLFEFKK